MNKPTKPTNLIPRSFGGTKDNWSASMQSSGYEANVPAVYSGGNLNYQLDTTGKELDYCEKICDFINDTPIGKSLITDVNNNLVYTKYSIRTYDINEIYSLNDVVMSIIDNEVKLFKSLINNNINNALSDDTYWEEVQFGGAWGDITGILSDQTDLNTALNGKVSKSACAEVYPVIQKYQSGTSWYRIYSDGWCEMGGQTTTRDEEVTFLKTFADTTYNVVGNEVVDSTASENELLIFKLSTNKIRVYCDYGGSQWSGGGACWVARGYLAEGQYNV